MNLLSSTIRRVSVHKFVVICVVSLALLLPQICMAKAKNAKQNKPQTVNEYVLKAIYFVPTNRKPVPEHIETIKTYIKAAQQFYAQEMARHGFYKPDTTEGKTFVYEADEKGEPIVHIFNAKYDDAHYKDGPAQYGMVYDEVTKVFSTEKSTYIIWTECCRILPDSTIVGPSCLGGAGESPGGAGGVAIMGSDGLTFLKPSFFNDTRPVDGIIDPEMGPYPIKHGVSYGGFAAGTVGNYASTCMGATSHELGHAFNLPHVFVNDDAPKIGGDLMGRGNQGFRGNYGDFPGEWCHLLKENCEMLNVWRVFNPGEPLTDKVAPKQTADVVFENAYNRMGKAIRIKVKGSDSGSGLYRSIAIVIPPWSTIKSAPFDANGIAEYTITPSEVPYDELKPKSYTLELLALDNQGNRSLIAYWVPVPQTILQEVPKGDGWRELPDGCWTTSNKLRIGMTVTANEENETVYPEVECQPVGKPFTGKPNYFGEAVQYKNQPVMGYVVIDNLPAGPYHWRIRLRTKTKNSVWVVPNNAESNATNFRVVESDLQN